MQTHWMLTTKSLVALSFSHHQIMVFVFVFVFVKIPEVAADSHLDVIGYFKLFLKWQFRFQFTKLFKWKQKFGSKEKSQRTNVAEKHLNVYANFVVYRVVVFFLFFFVRSVAFNHLDDMLLNFMHTVVYLAALHLIISKQ